MMKRMTLSVVLAALLIVSAAPAALASDQSTKEKAGWGCAEAVGLPAGHCISPGTVKRFNQIIERGLTFQLLVFDGSGDFLTAESATFGDASDRPCLHDPKAAPSYKYWEFVPGLWVCHHQPG